MVTEKVVSGIVVDWHFQKTNDEAPIRLYLELKMFDGQWQSILLDLKYLPNLFDLFYSRDKLLSNELTLDFMHCTMMCMVKSQFKDTPLGVMRDSYRIIAVRSNVHQEWCYVE